MIQNNTVHFPLYTVHCTLTNADLAHLVERHLAKVEVASSSLVIRSSAMRVYLVSAL